MGADGRALLQQFYLAAMLREVDGVETRARLQRVAAQPALATRRELRVVGHVLHGPAFSDRA